MEDRERDLGLVAAVELELVVLDAEAAAISAMGLSRARCATSRFEGFESARWRAARRPGRPPP